MGIYNEQGELIGEPQPHHMLIKDIKGRPRHSRRNLSAAPRKLSKAPPKDIFSQTMFMVGGWTKEDPRCSVEQFYPEYNEWRAAAPMVNPRTNVGVCTFDGKIYTVGGEDNVRCYSSVESTLTRPPLFDPHYGRYDPTTDSWSADVAPLSSPRSGVCLIEMDGFLYAIGGHDGTTAMSTVERFDPKMNTWSKQTPMLTRRSRAVAAVLNGQLYMIGGNDGDMAISSVERFDPMDGTWTLCPHMLSPRENAGCTVFLGCIYVAGGKDELNLDLCTVERFNPDSMRWTPVRRMRSKRNLNSLLVFNGALLAMGGSDGITNLRSIEVYNEENNTWRHFGSMKKKHPGGRAAAFC